jgi:hypothetical protein
VAVEDGASVYYCCVWIEGSQSASERPAGVNDWNRRWAREPHCTAQELAILCCGWNPESDVPGVPGVLPDAVWSSEEIVALLD